ncbi:hypothetical protein EVAR_71832_1 [Eumeta japonica]|uniref:Regulatory protein zeste n=1 Tax=Eumeta variegata TaxID=151549 RepID=A0A4C2ABT6_EUMVA|nr:hypothetical protein EVAR_71832_1 [Eumeta japonica]
MVEFMVLHPDLAKGLLNVSNAKSKSRELWERLSQDLNAAGPPSHNVEKWKKSHRNKLCLSGTGGGQSNYCSLTPLEERVSELLDFSSYIQGMSNTSRFGAPASTSAIENTEEKDEAIVDDEDMEGIEINGKALDLDSSKQSSNNILSIHTPPCRSRDLFKKQTLLEKQVENQIKYQKFYRTFNTI